MNEEILKFLKEVSEHKDNYMPTRFKLWAKQLLCSEINNGITCPECKSKSVGKIYKHNICVNCWNKWEIKN